MKSLFKDIVGGAAQEKPSSAGYAPLEGFQEAHRAAVFQPRPAAAPSQPSPAAHFAGHSAQAPPKPAKQPPAMGQAMASQKADAEASAAKADDGVTWWFRLLARATGTVGGLLSVFFGIWVAVSFSASCVAAGLLQMVFGFLVVCLESPCLCMWFEFIEKINVFSEGRSYWQKALVYGALGLTPLVMCFSPFTFLGSGIIAVTGVLYGMMAFGKKADQATMMAAAEAGQGGGAAFPVSGGTTPTDAWDAGLVANEHNPQQKQHISDFP